jgi:uncharacterized protein (DUF488 family)
MGLAPVLTKTWPTLWGYAEWRCTNGWREESFRGYADYMQTQAFDGEVDWLMKLADFDTAVVMCAEAVPWRCRRSLIADALMARGGVVEDIFVEANGGIRAIRKQFPTGANKP